MHSITAIPVLIKLLRSSYPSASLLFLHLLSIMSSHHCISLPPHPYPSPPLQLSFLAHLKPAVFSLLSMHQDIPYEPILDETNAVERFDLLAKKLVAMRNTFLRPPKSQPLITELATEDVSFPGDFPQEVKDVILEKCAFDDQICFGLTNKKMYSTLKILHPGAIGYPVQGFLCEKDSESFFVRMWGSTLGYKIFDHPYMGPVMCSTKVFGDFSTGDNYSERFITTMHRWCARKCIQEALNTDLPGEDAGMQQQRLALKKQGIPTPCYRGDDWYVETHKYWEFALSVDQSPLNQNQDHLIGFLFYEAAQHRAQVMLRLGAEGTSS